MVDIRFKYEFCPNGFYRKEISWRQDKRVFFFCDCKVCQDKVYELRPVDISKKVSTEMMNRFKIRKKCEDVRNEITYENVDAVESFLTSNQSNGHTT